MIVGAGLAGLIAAYAFPKAGLIEAAREPAEAHRALLRFRTKEVSNLTGIPFRKVRVRKGIWAEGEWQAPNIRHCNMYSSKVLGIVTDRSIWDTRAVNRYVAPETFYEQLIESVGKRIIWNTPFDYKDAKYEDTISTAPMNLALESLGKPLEGVKFSKAAIQVLRFRISDADVHQTVYFPDSNHSLYRASITGDLLICEFSSDPALTETYWKEHLRKAFGISWQVDLSYSEPSSQRYGKIVPIDEPTRKAVVARLTTDYNIFSLGRFATWRNIVLDDVVKDTAVIKRLITASAYERRITSL